MFGVGFYSVFAVTEQPIVRSGDEYLAFHWKGDMLVTTRGQIESDAPVAQKAEDKKWVSFILEGREPLPLDLDQLCKCVLGRHHSCTHHRTRAHTAPPHHRTRRHTHVC
jgi:hypothetical protein